VQFGIESRIAPYTAADRPVMRSRPEQVLALSHISFIQLRDWSLFQHLAFEEGLVIRWTTCSTRCCWSVAHSVPVFGYLYPMPISAKCVTLMSFEDDQMYCVLIGTRTHVSQ